MTLASIDADDVVLLVVDIRSLSPFSSRNILAVVAAKFSLLKLDNATCGCDDDAVVVVDDSDDDDDFSTKSSCIAIDLSALESQLLSMQLDLLDWTLCSDDRLNDVLWVLARIDCIDTKPINKNYKQIIAVILKYKTKNAS